jgi:hypothetical protein
MRAVTATRMSSLSTDVASRSTQPTIVDVTDPPNGRARRRGAAFDRATV